ncbi:MAG: hypothetical protein RBQ79_05115 [Sphaerochaetaceae bacterium]|jgi:hypothetical protein|nr:hypothetical protein [Sphaerochaetaceae bacterium]
MQKISKNISAASFQQKNLEKSTSNILGATDSTALAKNDRGLGRTFHS